MGETNHKQTRPQHEFNIESMWLYIVNNRLVFIYNPTYIASVI